MWRKQIRAHRVAVYVSPPFSISYSPWRPSMGGGLDPSYCGPVRLSTLLMFAFDGLFEQAPPAPATLSPG